MPFSNTTSDDLIRLLFNNTTLPSLYMSLHTDHPGDELANEVSYPGYARQLFAGAGYTTFPQSAGGDQLVTHAALSASAAGGVALVIAEVRPGIPVRSGVSPQVMLAFDVPSLFPSAPAAPPPAPPATMGSRFAALAAELEYEEERAEDGRASAEDPDEDEPGAADYFDEMNED